MAMKQRQVLTCGVPHRQLSPGDQEACALALPCRVRDQMRILIEKYNGKTSVVAVVLGVSEFTVRRHARGSLLPPGSTLRRALRALMLQARCPVFVAADEAEAERGEQRRARRAALRAMREGRNG